MTKFYEYLGIPFGFVISVFYALTGNYLLSIFFLTVIVRLCLLPASIKQQKGQAMQQRLQPKTRRIREKYGNDQRKIQEETQALYQREGVSAMGGGCLPMLIQVPIMIGLYQVNYHPFSMVLRIPKSVTASIVEAVKPLLNETELKSTFRLELFALQHWKELDLSSISGLTNDYIQKINLFIDKFHIFGLGLSETPSFKHFSVLWVVPIVSGLVALLTSIYTMSRQKKMSPEISKNPTMGCMMFMTPAMQVYFAFLFPISVGIYIIMSTTISFIQTLVINSVYSPKKVLAKTMIEETIYRRSKEENTKKIIEFKQD